MSGSYNEISFYFSDLNSDAQQRFLDAYNLKTAAEGNYDHDIFPLFTIVLDEEDGK